MTCVLFSKFDKSRAREKTLVNNDPSPEDTLARKPDSPTIQNQPNKILKSSQKDTKVVSKVRTRII